MISLTNIFVLVLVIKKVNLISFNYMYRVNVQVNTSNKEENLSRGLSMFILSNKIIRFLVRKHYKHG